MKAKLSIYLWSWYKQFSLITNYSDDDLQVKQIEIFDFFFLLLCPLKTKIVDMPKCLTALLWNLTIITEEAESYVCWFLRVFIFNHVES